MSKKLLNFIDGMTSPSDRRDKADAVRSILEAHGSSGEKGYEPGRAIRRSCHFKGEPLAARRGDIVFCVAGICRLPIRRRAVQALRSTRFVEGIARGRLPPPDHRFAAGPASSRPSLCRHPPFPTRSQPSFTCSL